MERHDLERILTDFQAKARGFLVRKELGAARQDYENIVREIEGDLSHLEWRGDVIARPLFSKNAFVWQCNPSPSNENSGEARSVCESTQPLGEAREEPSQVQCLTSDSQVTAPHQQEQADCGPAVTDSESPRPAEGDANLDLGPGTQSEAGVLEGGSPRRVAESWDGTAADAGFSFLQKGFLRRSLAQHIPRKEAELCLHRNNLNMELLWLQQAISSRKKYLQLKQRLGGLDR